ncbi:MAG TPA: CoA ester lyase [Steroidobacteraceae bacterium]|jgi:citrate lyase subunit beta/citryl-CoA lyase
MRSLLFVPADSDRKLAKAAAAGADGLILDLEDSVLPERKPHARERAAQYLGDSSERAAVWVRVNDRLSGELLRDLAAIVPARPAGIVLPKILGPHDIEAVAHYLEALEVSHDVEPGSIAMLALVTETPAALLRMPQLLELECERLRGISWGAEDLSAALGAGDPRTDGGAWRATYEHARIQCLLAAHALAIEAIDSVYVNYRDPDGLRQACEQSRHDGFTGRLAIHPDQVPVINAAFTPSESERVLAQRIVAAFGNVAGAGTISLDGKMYDLPHLKAARRLLGLQGL